jgi:hypothetical protein
MTVSTITYISKSIKGALIDWSEGKVSGPHSQEITGYVFQVEAIVHQRAQILIYNGHELLTRKRHWC